MTGTVRIIRADSRRLPLADDSVDLVVTSPPYFALRSYTDNGQHYDGQIGAECAPDEFLSSLLEVTSECVRVLKPSGSLWVNLGDKYSGAQAQNVGGVNRAGDSARTWAQTNPKRTGIPNKSLCGIPWRYALRCIDDLGLILRAEVIWSKPNGLPESVTDRVRRSHEQWFHFTLSPRYFSAVDEIREPHAAHTLYCAEWEKGKPGGKYERERVNKDRMDGGNRTSATGPHPLGKLPGSVWTIPTEPLRVPDHLGVDHFAAFPTEWPRRIIAGWSPAGVCTACGEGRRPIVHAPSPAGHVGASIRDHDGKTGGPALGATSSLKLSGGPAQRWREQNPATIKGYECACWRSDCRHMTRCADAVCSYPEPPTQPAVVLDPFGGTGTTALVAKALGRHGISVDMSADYCRLASWRVNDPDSLAHAMRVDKPARQVVGQESLFEEETA